MNAQSPQVNRKRMVRALGKVAEARRLECWAWALGVATAFWSACVLSPLSHASCLTAIPESRMATLNRLLGGGQASQPLPSRFPACQLTRHPCLVLRASRRRSNRQRGCLPRGSRNVSAARDLEALWGQNRSRSLPAIGRAAGKPPFPSSAPWNDL